MVRLYHFLQLEVQSPSPEGRIHFRAVGDYLNLAIATHPGLNPQLELGETSNAFVSNGLNVAISQHIQHRTLFVCVDPQDQSLSTVIFDTLEKLELALQQLLQVIPVKSSDICRELTLRFS